MLCLDGSYSIDDVHVSSCKVRRLQIVEAYTELIGRASNFLPELVRCRHAEHAMLVLGVTPSSCRAPLPKVMRILVKRRIIWDSP